MKELKDLQLYDKVVVVRTCAGEIHRKVGDVFQMCSKATNEIYLKSIN